MQDRRRQDCGRLGSPASRRSPFGEQVGAGRKSIAFAVSFQSAERTLTDEDAAALRDRIVQALRERFGAELRA
jgi:phenylalanyl-tRNA synthetase beta subunit